MVIVTRPFIQKGTFSIRELILGRNNIVTGKTQVNTSVKISKHSRETGKAINHKSVSSMKFRCTLSCDMWVKAFPWALHSNGFLPVWIFWTSLKTDRWRSPQIQYTYRSLSSVSITVYKGKWFFGECLPILNACISDGMLGPRLDYKKLVFPLGPPLYLWWSLTRREANHHIVSGPMEGLAWWGTKVWLATRETIRRTNNYEHEKWFSFPNWQFEWNITRESHQTYLPS